MSLKSVDVAQAEIENIFIAVQTDRLDAFGEDPTETQVSLKSVVVPVFFVQR
jgi:hypothetical protein